ncbi:MAG: hypothetical protein J6X40_06795 [Bacteroidales bacterium]|nr:hypothetical protein [Bacteroidales bacterium]
MKASRTLLFILSVFLLLGIAWFAFPAEGVALGKLELRFPSYAQDKMGEEEGPDVDAILDEVSKSFEMTCSETLLDSLTFFRDYLTLNPNRIYLPNDDYSYFDDLFQLLEQAAKQHKTYRVMHYGDSQIEMDRITSVLRQRMQERFGGSGPNMIPAIQRVASMSISQSYSGGLTRYTMYGDSTTRRAPHNRYGVMTQFSQTGGSATISFTKTRHSKALENVKEISSVSVLIGNNSEGFKATLKADTLKTEPIVCAAKKGVSLIHWDLPAQVGKGTITLQGSAEVYAVLLDGDAGVAVDNVPLRGCSGTIFTRGNKEVMQESFELMDTRMIILQFGGNRMPSIYNTKSVTNYMAELEKQINYFKEVAPQATLLFIGPADMGKSYNGKMGTWKGLPELNDSLRSMALHNDVAYWDMFHVMGGEGSMAQYVKHNPPLAGPDYIHFTTLGAQEIGDDLAKSFLTYYDFYKLRQDLPDELPADSLYGFMHKDRELIEKEKALRSRKFEPTQYYLP